MQKNILFSILALLLSIGAKAQCPTLLNEDAGDGSSIVLTLASAADCPNFPALSSLNITSSAGTGVYGITTCQTNFGVTNVQLTYDSGAPVFQADTPITFMVGGSTCAYGAGGALPVKLLTFTGHKENSLHRLDWTTATEQNTSHFDVQYSATGKDFVTLGNTRAAGNSNTPQHYSFDNKNTKAGVNYYRLKIVDFDGSFDYSNTIVIKENDKTETITAFPNPSGTGIFTLQGKTFERTDATVSNVLGQNINIIIQNNVLDLSAMPSGVYFVRIAGEDNTIRVIKS